MNAHVEPDLDSQAKVYARGELTAYLLKEGYQPTGFHTYTDTTGTPIYWKVRLRHDAKGKTLRAFARNDGRIHSKTNQPYQGQFMPCEPSNAWQANYPAGQGKKPLYRLHELSSNPEQLVFIVEGEQKADALAKLGIIATTSGSSGSVNATYWDVLAGRNVRIWRDYDEAGAKYQGEVKAFLESLGCVVSIVDVDALGLPVKGDVIDWLAMRKEQGLETAAANILALALVDGLEPVTDETVTESVTAESPLDNALAIIELAFIRANDADNPDVGVLWELETINAVRQVHEVSKPDYARVRVRLKQCKDLKLSEYEREIIPQSDDGGNIDSCSILIEIASTACTFVHNQDSDPYAILTIGNVRQCWHLQSKSYGEWLSHSFYKQEGTAPSELSIRAAINALTGKAKFEGDEISVHVRIAKHDGAYWLDLCNDAWQAVQITAAGWQVVDHPPVMFTRSSSMRPLPVPTAGTGNLSALWTVANIPESDHLMIVAWLLECFRPETSFVVLGLFGEQGSAKSSTQKALRNLIDPNRSNLRAAPKNKEDMFISARNSHMVSYENLSHLSAEYQDALCSVATGAGHASRTLYTNADETVIDLKKPIVLNGIPVVITAQDLVDRSITIDCPMLATPETEASLDAYWSENYASIFCGLLDAFVLALAQLPSVDLSDEKLPRMTDFTLLGEAVYQSHGRAPKTFLNEYRERRKEGVNRTLESSPVAVAMIAYLNHNPNGFSGTVGELLTALDDYREHSETWVKSPKGLGDAIQRLKPAMRQIGIHLSKDTKAGRNGYGCTLKFETPIYSAGKKTPKPSSQCSPSSQKSQKTAFSEPKCELGELGELQNETFIAETYIPPDLLAANHSNDGELETGEI
jgi:hypothetical protein